MPPRTRTSKGLPAAATPTSDDSKPIYSLPAQSASPSMVFILPRAATPEAKIVTLPNPRHSKPARYLACPSTGLYEFTKISPAKSAPRSWLIESTGASVTSEHGETKETRMAKIIKGGDMFVATPIDPLFLALPALVGPTTSTDTKRLFIASDCHLENLAEEASHLQEVLRIQGVRELFERRMAAVCDEVKVGDERMFRLNEDKLVKEILDKAKRVADGQLPASMEDRFVTKALEAPVLVTTNAPPATGGGTTTATTAPPSEVSTPQNESVDSQLSNTTSASTASSSDSQASTVATSVAVDEGAAIVEEPIVRAAEASAEVVTLQRLRVALNFICSSYVPPAIASWLLEKMANPKIASTDFKPLDEYLAQLVIAKAEAAATRNMDMSRKHDLDIEEDEVRAEKKRKMEEEKKKKAQESRAIRDLKKVNTSGMRKMSDFFKKK